MLTPSGIAEQASCPVDVVQRALKQKRAFLLIDGLDETPQKMRDGLVDVLLRFASRQSEARIIVTSRPAGPPGAAEKSLPAPQPFVLNELTQERSAHSSTSGALRPRSRSARTTEAEKEAAKAAADLKRRLDMSFAVQKIAVNPLLVTILCVVHRFLGRTIPSTGSPSTRSARTLCSMSGIKPSFPKAPRSEASMQTRNGTFSRGSREPSMRGIQQRSKSEKLSSTSQNGLGI